MTIDSLHGKTFGSYEALELLGRGGMASVYRARHRLLGNNAALKLIEANLAGDPAYSKRFQREARSLVSLRHPHVVHYYEFGVVGNLHYLVVEYVDGADLRWVLDEYRRRGERLPLCDLVNLVDQLAGALDYIHSRGVIHRDVKPANILLDRRGQAILSDFGVALNVADTQPEPAAGSAHYAAPEQIAPGGQASPQTDIYSLGVVLYEMLTGRVPFDGDSAVAIGYKHMQADPIAVSAFDSALPPAVDDVVEQALAKEPAARYATATAFAGALRQALGPLLAVTAPSARTTASNGHGPDARSSHTLPEVLAARPLAAPPTPFQPAAPSVPGVARPRSSTGRERALRLAPWLGALCAVVLVAWLRAGPPAESAAAPPAAPGEPTQAGPDGVGEFLATALPSASTGSPNVLMVYDDDAITVLNIGPDPLYFTGVSFAQSSPSGEPAPAFAADQWINRSDQDELEPNYCYRLIRYGADSRTPAECELAEQWISTSDTSVHFWRSDTAEEFVVLRNGEPLQRCRIAEGQCSFFLPPP